MNKLILFGTIIIASLALSCARRVTNYETGMMMSSQVYNDIAPQVNSVLHSPSADPARIEQLKLVNQKLDEYTKAYNELTGALSAWKTSGKAPNNIMDVYLKMWRSLLEAQHLAAQVHIYASACSANTGLKGKACQ
jgi:hypothetical protein